MSKFPTLKMSSNFRSSSVPKEDLDAKLKELEEEFDISARGFFPAMEPLRH